MGNITAFSQAQTAATALSNLILVSPQTVIGYQPQNPAVQNGAPMQPPPSLLFHYEGEQTATLQSDITDHYIEDNTALQDQISLKPEEITTHGFIGELNDVVPPILATLQTAANKLTIVSAYTPVLSEAGLIAYNTAFQLYQIASNAKTAAVSAWNTVTGKAPSGTSVIGSTGIENNQPNQTKQQLMFQQFYGYWTSRTLFTVQTPWAIFKNMAIKSLRAVQDAETNVITDFEVTFKMIRIASTQISVFDPAFLQGRAAAQGAGVTDLGTSTPVPSITIASGLSNYAGNIS